jgi:hypothetical protein
MHTSNHEMYFQCIKLELFHWHNLKDKLTIQHQLVLKQFRNIEKGFGKDR